ncbi:glycoside hydrolase family 73 protein [Capnocytophaga gingivalis]|nr:MAG TPA: Muramidase (flagellum-specific) [Caudoviricetes sp.]
MTQKDFIKTYKPFALETERKTGISHLFILAQSALETGWGKRAPGNMMFGVKASISTPLEKRQLVQTTEILSTDKAKFPVIISIEKRPDGRFKYIVKDWFRKYDSPEESFTDHANLFMNNKRYAKALLVRSDPYKFAEEVANAGYATEPTYAERLKGVIRTIEKNDK